MAVNLYPDNAVKFFSVTTFNTTQMPTIGSALTSGITRSDAAPKSTFAIEGMFNAVTANATAVFKNGMVVEFAQTPDAHYSIYSQLQDAIANNHADGDTHNPRTSPEVDYPQAFVGFISNTNNAIYYGDGTSWTKMTYTSGNKLQAVASNAKYIRLVFSPEYLRSIVGTNTIVDVPMHPKEYKIVEDPIIMTKVGGSSSYTSTANGNTVNITKNLGWYGKQNYFTVGTGSGASMTNGTMAPAVTPSTGYTFMGWNTASATPNASFSTAYTCDAPATLPQLYAFFAMNNDYNVKYAISVWNIVPSTGSYAAAAVAGNTTTHLTVTMPTAQQVAGAINTTDNQRVDTYWGGANSWTISAKDGYRLSATNAVVANQNTVSYSNGTVTYTIAGDASVTDRLWTVNMVQNKATVSIKEVFANNDGSAWSYAQSGSAFTTMADAVNVTDSVTPENDTDVFTHNQSGSWSTPRVTGDYTFLGYKWDEVPSGNPWENLDYTINDNSVVFTKNNIACQTTDTNYTLYAVWCKTSLLNGTITATNIHNY